MERLKRLERLFLKNCEYNKLQGANQCLAHGIDVNAKNHNGSALILACESGHSAIVTRLIQGDTFYSGFILIGGASALLRYYWLSKSFYCHGFGCF